MRARGSSGGKACVRASRCVRACVCEGRRANRAGVCGCIRSCMPEHTRAPASSHCHVLLERACVCAGRAGVCESAVVRSGCAWAHGSVSARACSSAGGSACAAGAGRAVVRVGVLAGVRACGCSCERPAASGCTCVQACKCAGKRDAGYAGAGESAGARVRGRADVRAWGRPCKHTHQAPQSQRPHAHTLERTRQPIRSPCLQKRHQPTTNFLEMHRNNILHFYYKICHRKLVLYDLMPAFGAAVGMRPAQSTFDGFLFYTCLACGTEGKVGAGG